jgi:hypothetical protein
MEETFNLGKSVLMRFTRGGIAGAFASTATLTSLTGIQSWTELRTALVFLGLSALIGFFTGGIMAVDKVLRSVPVV